jgi:hypothetical protein
MLMATLTVSSPPSLGFLVAAVDRSTFACSLASPLLCLFCRELSVELSLSFAMT